MMVISTLEAVNMFLGSKVGMSGLGETLAVVSTTPSREAPSREGEKVFVCLYSPVISFK